MRKKIVIVLLVLLSCTGVFLLLKISTWHAVFLFSEKDLEWLAPYHDGDMVFYTSPTGMDTMIVSRNLYNAPGLLGLYCFSDFHAEGEYINIIYHNGNRIDCKLIIVKESDNIVNIVNQFDRRYSNDKFLESDTSRVVVKGDVYDDAITMDDTNSSITQKLSNSFFSLFVILDIERRYGFITISFCPNGMLSRQRIIDRDNSTGSSSSMIEKNTFVLYGNLAQRSLNKSDLSSCVIIYFSHSKLIENSHTNKYKETQKSPLQ